MDALVDLFKLENGVPGVYAGIAKAAEPLTCLICDGPLPRALAVPQHLRMVVPLAQPLNQLTAHWKLAHRRRDFVEGCTQRAISAPEEVKAVHREMLEPFAHARHSGRAVVLDEREVLRLSRQGHLGLLCRDGEPIAAHLGYTYVRQQQRYWCCLRVGYPRQIYEDDARLADANTANTYWAIRYAKDSEHDVFDFGISPASPDGGLLQFKHRRSGELSAFGCGTPLWIRLPRAEVGEFLWRWPLFSLERQGIVLNVGVPSSASDAEVLSRLRPVGYRGVACVRIHCGRDLSSLLSALHDALDTKSGGTRRVVAIELAQC